MKRSILFIAMLVLITFSRPVKGQDDAVKNGMQRVLANQLFHQQASQKVGLLIPLYIYPADIHTNADDNRVMDLKRQYSEVPFWVIVNPASGPGTEVDANYTTAHDMGYWPTVANPGTDTPGRYFAAEAADVIVVHESDHWPTEAQLHGNYFGSYSDYPPRPARR